MSPLSCRQAEELLDLYAADACAPPEAEAVSAHLATCAACAATLERSRELVALLDWQAREPDARRRLDGRVAAEGRSRRTLLRTPPPLVRRLGSLAALLLVAVGLAGWLGRGGVVPGVLPEPGEEVIAAVTLTPAAVEFTDGAAKPFPEAMVGPARGDKERAVDEGALKILLDKHAQAEAEARPGREVRVRAEAGAPVRLSLDVRNDLGRPMLLRLDDERTQALLELSGPGVRRQPAPEGATPELSPPTLRLEPGETKRVTLRRLVSGPPGARTVLSLAVPGDYVLTVRLRVEAEFPATGRERGREGVVWLAAPPVRLRVTGE
jgi:hypothetical protein